MTREPPRILRVKSQPLPALRKTSVAGRGGRSPVRVVDGKLRRIRRVKSRIVREGIQRFLIARKRTAKHWFVDEIHSELERMIASAMAHVIAKLIFLLVAQRRKERDRGGELIIAIGLEARHRQRRRTERKGERETKRGVSCLRQMQQTGVEYKGPQPR